MIVRPKDWSPQIFHQKGWIANKFFVKNPNSAALRWKKRNQTETHLHQPKQQSNPQNAQYHSTQMHKPNTAPNKNRSKMQIVENLQKIGACSGTWQQPCPISQSRYSTFRTTVHHRKQLLYIKPYTRYQNNSLTIDQKKMEVYKEINNPDLSFYLNSYENNSKMIEYLTEYSDPFEPKPLAREQKPKRDGRNAKNRTSLNILREKLKRKCEPSPYKSKLNSVKIQ